MKIKHFFNRIVLQANNFICNDKQIVSFLLDVKFNKVINEVIDYCQAKRYLFKKEDFKKAILTAYFKTPVKQRKYLKQTILINKALADASEKMRKSQRPNDKCNCGKGKKFKNCCRPKY